MIENPNYQPNPVRQRYLERMWERGLRPIIYLPTGTVWPTIEAVCEVTEVSRHRIITECESEGNFAYFPEYFWYGGPGYVAGWHQTFQIYLSYIGEGRAWTPVNPPERVFFVADLEDPEDDPHWKGTGNYRAHGIINLTSGRSYPSITECAQDLGVTRRTVYKALARDGRVGNNRLVSLRWTDKSLQREAAQPWRTAATLAKTYHIRIRPPDPED